MDPLQSRLPVAARPPGVSSLKGGGPASFMTVPGPQAEAVETGGSGLARPAAQPLVGGQALGDLGLMGQPYPNGPWTARINRRPGALGKKARGSMDLRR